MANIVVLAKCTKQITRAYENGAGSALTYQGRLFPEVCIEACDPGLSTRHTEAGFPCQPVYPAFSRAKIAGPHKFQSLFSPNLEFTITVEL
jgi:hypothetical protein